MNVGFISLGCSKNLVDTEMMIGLFKKNKLKIVNNPEISEIIVINTCGFIESAKEEAINTILEMAEFKKNGKCKYLIVTGCLVQRYEKELKEALPEVDLFIKIDNYDNLWTKVQKIINLEEEQEDEKLHYVDRVITTGKNTAYLKIAEGCSNNCTYCAIPYIRGKYKSRKMENILEEANKLAKEGYKELIVIAQDTTKYGIDIYDKPMLAELLEKLAQIEGFKWIRFLYSYPESLSNEIIDVVKKTDKICNYFDIPIQHISNEVLKRMNRRSTKNEIIEKIEKIRKEIPDAVLRTSLIVGFPGETNEQFEELYEFVKKIKFDKLGVFKYSKEEGTPAEKLKEQISEDIKEERYEKIMELQNEISKQKLETKIGNTYEVLIENSIMNNTKLIGRTYMDSPEIDGVVIMKNKDREIIKDDFLKCKITKIKDYDLIAEIIK